jgi:hypothetical protein
VTAAKTMVRAAVAAALCAGALLAQAGDARAAESVTYGVQDDAWLLHGEGTLDSRLNELERLGVEIVRFTIRWDQVASSRPANPRNPRDEAYDWSGADSVLRGLHRRGLATVVTLVGTPGWANGGRSANWAPTSESALANFAYAAANRYPWIRYWTVWNEPNQPIWLRPTSAAVYVRKLLNPAYRQIHAVISDARVGGGMTSPRSGSGVSPVAWIRAMGEANALLDAYAHHPYPNRPQSESPWGPACARCSTISMAELERLEREVQDAFGPTRIWLTEYGYQTNPPDTTLGVSLATQADYLSSASRRVYLAPYVDMLIFFLVRDDADSDGWQSGLTSADGRPKPSYTAFRLPLTQASREGSQVVVWGQVRPRASAQPYRIRIFEDGRWSWVGGTRSTDARGFLSATVRASPGALIQLWSTRDAAYSLAVRVS